MRSDAHSTVAMLENAFNVNAKGPLAIFSGFVWDANRVLNMHFQVGEPWGTGWGTSKRVFTTSPYIIV